MSRFINTFLDEREGSSDMKWPSMEPTQSYTERDLYRGLGTRSSPFIKSENM